MRPFALLMCHWSSCLGEKQHTMSEKGASASSRSPDRFDDSLEGKPLDTWTEGDVQSFISRHFSSEIAKKFEDQEINGDSLICLTRKADEDEIFVKLGLQTFGKLVKFRKLIEGLLPCHEKISRPVTPTSSICSKPSLTELASYGKDIQLLYKAKRSRIQRAAVKMWPGNNFPNFRLAEEKNKLDDLAKSLEEECSIPEINFGTDGIKKHIQSVFSERRRSRKREKVDYDLPDKRLRTSTSAEENKPKLPTMLLHDGSEDEDQKGSGQNEAGFESDENESDASREHTEVIENSQCDPEITAVNKTYKRDQQEITALNMTYKSAKVLLMTYSGKKKMEDINRVYLLSVLKELGGKVSLAKTLEFEALAKAVAVKLVNNKRLNLKNGASFSNLKRSDVVICSKK